jgi:hypothetical protein
VVIARHDVGPIDATWLTCQAQQRSGSAQDLDGRQFRCSLLAIAKVNWKLEHGKPSVHEPPHADQEKRVAVPVDRFYQARGDSIEPRGPERSRVLGQWKPQEPMRQSIGGPAEQ